jgi:hypothetical protein
MTNPLKCLGEMLATFVGRALGGAFFLLGKARGKKALHPRGEVLQGLIGRHGAVGRTGVPWLDEAGTDHVAVRLSRSLGLPAPRPDILGLALRIPTQPGQFGDVLLATTGTGPSADMCCCRHAGMVCAPTHRCFLTGPWLAPSCWQRFRPRAARDSTSWPTPG